MAMVGRGVVLPKWTTDSCLSVDMASLLSHTDLETPSTQVVKLYRGPWQKGYAALDVLASRALRLRQLRIDRETGEPAQVETIINLVDTPCNFGGIRLWFQCPRCGRRCRILYVAPVATHLGCRVCLNLTYRSQQDASAVIVKAIQSMALVDDIVAQYNRARPGRRKERLQRKIDGMVASFKALQGWSEQAERRR